MKERQGWGLWAIQSMCAAWQGMGWPGLNVPLLFALALQVVHRQPRHLHTVHLHSYAIRTGTSRGSGNAVPFIIRCTHIHLRAHAACVPCGRRAEELRILRGEQEVDEANLRLGDLDDDDMDDLDDVSEPSLDQVGLVLSCVFACGCGGGRSACFF